MGEGLSALPAPPETAMTDATSNLNQRSWYQRNRLAVTPWLFLAPAILFFTVYVILPIFQSIWISFFEWDGLGEKTWVGTANYIELMDDDRFYTSLKNNVIWLVLYMLAVPIGLFIALFLNQTVFGIRLYKSLFFFPRSLAADCLLHDLVSDRPEQCFAGSD